MPAATHAVDFHAHVYFHEGNEPEALALRDSLRGLAVEGLTLGRVNEGPRGPHTVASYEIFVPFAAFGTVVPWLAFHRGTLDVLVHPLTDDEVGDHTARALWLGVSKPLRLEALAPPAPATGAPSSGQAEP